MVGKVLLSALKCNQRFTWASEANLLRSRNTGHTPLSCFVPCVRSTLSLYYGIDVLVVIQHVCLANTLE